MKNSLLVHEYKQWAISHARWERLSETTIPRCDVLHQWEYAQVCVVGFHAANPAVCRGCGFEVLGVWGGWRLLVRRWKPTPLSKIMWEEGKGKALNRAATAGEENPMLGSGWHCIWKGDHFLPLPLSSALATWLSGPRSSCAPQRLALPLELIKSATVQHLLKSHLGLCWWNRY